MVVVFLRSIVLYIAVLISMRIMGKGEIAEMNCFDLVITLLIAEVASLPMENNDIPMINGIAALTGLVAMQTIISFLSLKFRKVSIVLSGKPSILINKGSNLMFGTISFVTNAAGGVLQLAVSMDYSIFLLHRFQEMREEGQAPKEAMINALCKSTGSILSSGLTTVIGFAALILMRFKIGPDMGLAMAKAIFISLVTVFVLFPVILLYCYPLIDKTAHKSLLPNFEKFGRFVTKLMVPAVLVFVLFIIPCNLGQKENFFSYGSSQIFSTDTQIGSDTKKIEDIFGKSNNLVLMVPKGDLQKESQLSKDLHNMPEVSSILSYVDNAGAEVPMDYVDNDTLSKLISDNYSRLVLTVDADFEGEKTFALIEEIRALAKTYYGDEYLLAGESASTYDLMDTITKDNDRVNLIAIGAVFLVLLLSMKSLSIPVILVLAIETAIWINLS
ncbi:MAG: MMPL family transporter, partial [Intestinibacter bartlettii]|nr:MMPL family transporter [Intestinibacter bartlettii]